MSRWDRWVGLPASRWPDEDCYGLVREVLATEFGVVWPHIDDIPPKPKDRAAVLDARRPLMPIDEVPLSEARAGDVLQMRNGAYPVHIGVMISPTNVLHLPPPPIGATVCESIAGANIRRTIVALWRPRPLD